MTVRDIAIVVHQIRGRVRLRLRSHTDRRALEALEGSFAALPGVIDLRGNGAAATLVVQFDPAVLSVEALLNRPLGDDFEGVGAGARVEESVHLDAPPEQVWSLLGGPGHLTAHLPALVHLREESAGRWMVTLELLGQWLEGSVRLRDVVPDRTITLALEGDVSGRYEVSLCAESEGTRLREQVSYDLRDVLLDKTLGRFGETVIRRLVREHLASIENELRKSPAADPAGG